MAAKIAISCGFGAVFKLVVSLDPTPFAAHVQLYFDRSKDSHGSADVSLIYPSLT